MRNHCMTVLAAASIALLAPTAQALSLGEFEYQNSCIACHGASGRGDGPMVRFLSETGAPDLTMLAKNNGGVFPVTRIYEVIEGTDMGTVHGSREMPIWGNRYRTRIDPVTDPAFSPEETDAYVRTRILSLIEYLSTLQQE